VALAVQLDDHVGTQGGVLLLAADPLVQLGRWPLSGWEGARVEGHEHRVQGRRGRLAAALAGGGNGALADGFGVAGRHPEAVAGEGLAQRRPGGPQLLCGGVDAAELLGPGEGTLGFGPVGEEAAGLPAQLVTCCGFTALQHRVLAGTRGVWPPRAGDAGLDGVSFPLGAWRVVARDRFLGWRAAYVGGLALAVVVGTENDSLGE
jgi:hypothetical protein